MRRPWKPGQRWAWNIAYRRSERRRERLFRWLDRIGTVYETVWP